MNGRKFALVGVIGFIFIAFGVFVIPLPQIPQTPPRSQRAANTQPPPDSLFATSAGRHIP